MTPTQGVALHRRSEHAHPAPIWPHPEAALNRRSTRLLWFLVLLGLAVRLVGVTAPYVDQYAWRSIDNAAIARNFVSQGMDIRYPRVDWAGPEGLVETELPLQMYVVAVCYRLIGREVAWLGRLSTALIAAGMLAVYGRLAIALLGRRAGLAALAVLALVPTSIFFSHTFQQDALMLLSQMVALFHAGRWLLGPGPERTRDPVLVALALALGALVKPTSLLIGVPIAVMAFQRYGLAALRQPRLYAVAMGALLPPLGWYLHARGIYLEHGYTFGIFSGGHDKFQWRRFLVQPGWYREMLTRMVTWHLTPPGTLLVAAGGWLLIRRPRPLRAVILAWMVTMVGFIPLVAEGNLDMVYYQWIAIPPLALLAGLAIDAAWSFRPARTLAVSLLLLLPITSIWLLRPSYEVVQKRHLKLAEAIRTSVPPGALLLNAGAYDVHNPGGYNYEPLDFYYSGHKGWGLLEEDFTIGDVERYRAMGATYLVSKSTAMLERHPAFLAEVRARYRVIREEPGILIVALESNT
jgi:hypothetical protein